MQIVQEYVENLLLRHYFNFLWKAFAKLKGVMKETLFSGGLKTLFKIV